MATSSDFQDYLSDAGKWAYWIIGLVVVFTMSNILYNRMNKQIAALLVFLAGILALYYYYVKWFMVNATKWPPVTTLCPDFMTYVGTDTATGNVYCIDLVGASSKPSEVAVYTGQFPTVGQAKDQADNGSAAILRISTADMQANARAVCQTITSKGLTWHTLCEQI